jgi:phage terminase small subunit
MARRKIADPNAAKPATAEDLPELTPQQQLFVDSLLRGKTATDAYREAYDCSGSGKNTVWVEASRLRHNPNIALWLAAARKAGLNRAAVTVEGHLAELDRPKEIALETGNVGAAVQAEQLRGKASGHYVEQFRDVTRDPVDMLKEIASLSPDLASTLAREHGIPWQQETKH